MKKFILLIFITPFLLASNIVDIYRQNGLEAVESQIISKLKNQDYWRDYLKDFDLSLGYYEYLDSLLIANKETRELSVYKAKNGSLELISTYKNVIVGANGDKQKEGDLKTPLGVYEITKRFKPTDQFYGPIAFSLSYPNTYDKVQGKNGYGIWIHGSPLDGSPRDPMSKGCIVLDNDTIDLLDSSINPKKSIVIVSEKTSPVVTIDDVSVILSELYRWQDAWRKNKLKEYLDFYASDFKRFDGMKKRYFSQMKETIFSRNLSKTIIFKNINISPYPNESNKKLFKISFYEIYNSKNYKFKGNKELFIELKDKTFLILSEK